jgi:hypothetical protein
VRVGKVKCLQGLADVSKTNLVQAVMLRPSAHTPRHCGHSMRNASAGWWDQVRSTEELVHDYESNGDVHNFFN